MSIENQIAELNTNLKALTAAIIAASGVKTAPAASGSAAKKETTAAAKKGAGKAETTSSAVTKAQMQAALNEVKEALGTDNARGIITNHGFAKMADITEDKYEAIYNEAKAAIEPQSAPGADLDDDGL